MGNQLRGWAAGPQVKQTKYVHQRRTRSNNPMPTITEEEEPPINATPTQAAKPPVTTRCKWATQRKARQVQCEIIGSKRNNVKVASRKRLQQLINLQTARDNIMLQQVKVNEEIQQNEVSIPPEPIYKATALPSPARKSTKIPTITQEEEPPPFTQASSYNSPRSDMFLSQEALHDGLSSHVIRF